MACSIGEMVPLFCFFYLLITSTASKEINQECRELRCSRHGPSVRFPFQLKGIHPDHCAYRTGFDLSCTTKNETVLELPVSVKLFVSKIDYQSQMLHLYDPTLTLLKRLQFLNLSDSPFSFVFRYSFSEGGRGIGYLPFQDYSLFNCSRTFHRWEYPVFPSQAGHQIVALDSSNSIDKSPSLFSCTKMYNVYSVPLDILYENHDIQFRWSSPKLECGSCKEEGKICGWKMNASEPQTLCFPKHRDRGASTGQVVTGVVLGSCLLAIIVMALYEAYISDKLDRENQIRIKRFMEDYKALKPTRYSYADIKRITNQFKEELGQGSYGTVFKGKLSNEILVAVKVLNETKGNGEEFINEVGTIGKIHHINVVRLVGFCADGFRRALVYEFLPNGSLQKFIASADSKTLFLGWEKLQGIALGVAKGLEYLHRGCDQRILHFDIKPHNILLDHNFNPKICDFGLSKMCSKDQSAVSMTTARGTIGYIAPEVFSRNFGNVSYKSDVYSFGMLLLEMVGGKKNIDGKDDNAVEAYYPDWIHNLLEDGEDLRIPIEGEESSKIAKKLATVGLWCIQWHPVDRPSMEVVVQMLEGKEDHLKIPPNSFDFTGTRPNASMPERRRRQQELDVISEVHQEMEEINDLQEE
ncbi:Protein kinase domain - like 10 [Theobroma cacao]|nr:Protein kinase domain - like 10 [Theobroma cacao]